MTGVGFSDERRGRILRRGLGSCLGCVSESCFEIKIGINVSRQGQVMFRNKGQDPIGFRDGVRLKL